MTKIDLEDILRRSIQNERKKEIDWRREKSIKETIQDN